MNESPFGPNKGKHDFYILPKSVQRDFKCLGPHFKISHKRGDTQKCQVVLNKEGFYQCPLMAGLKVSQGAVRTERYEMTLDKKKKM